MQPSPPRRRGAADRGWLWLLLSIVAIVDVAIQVGEGFSMPLRTTTSSLARSTGRRSSSSSSSTTATSIIVVFQTEHSNDHNTDDGADDNTDGTNSSGERSKNNSEANKTTFPVLSDSELRELKEKAGRDVDNRLLLPSRIGEVINKFFYTAAVTFVVFGYLLNFAGYSYVRGPDGKVSIDTMEVRMFQDEVNRSARGR